MTVKLNALTRGLLLAAGGVTISTSDALAQQRSVQVVVVADESGSMAGEHDFLEDFMPALDLSLRSVGVTQTGYGLVGYGAASPAPRSFAVAGAPFTFGTPTQFATAAQQLLISGGFEDGYAGINFALDNYTFTATTRVLILVTDEDRDVLDPAITLSSITAKLDTAGVTLAGILDQTIANQTGQRALGADATRTFVDTNNDGVVEFSTAPVFGFAEGATLTEYTQPIIGRENGCVADLNQLRAGGAPARAFAQALTVCVVRQSLEGEAPDVQVPTPAASNPILFLPTPPTRDLLSVISKSAAPQETAQRRPGMVEILGDRGGRLYGTLSGGVTTLEPIADQIGGEATHVQGTIGADFRPTANTGLGVAVSYVMSDTEAEGQPSTVENTAIIGQLYGGVRSGPMFFAAALSAGPLDYTTARNLGAGSVAGETSGFTSQVDLEAGYDLPFQAVDAAVRLGARGTMATVDAYAETGTGGLSFGEQSYTQVDVLLGGSVGRSTQTKEIGFGFFLDGAVEYAVSQASDDVTVALLGASLPSIKIESPDPLSFVLAPGLSFAALGGRLQGLLQYRGRINPDVTGHTVSATVGFKF